jgi:Protein of unknown function (DUF1631)
MTEIEFPPSELTARLLERTSRQLTLATGYSIALVAQDLEAAGEKSPQHDLRRRLFAAAATLKIEHSSRALRVAEALVAARSQPTGPASDINLAVLGTHDQELHIAASEISRKVAEDIDSQESSSGLSYEAFKDRSAKLFQTTADDTGNPIGAAMLARAACSVFRGLTNEATADAILRQILVDRLTPAVADVVSQAHHKMIKFNVLPDWRSRIVKQEVAADIPDVEDPGFERVLNASSEASSNGERLGTSPLATIANPADNMAWLPTLQPVVDIERDAVAFAHSVNVVPYSRESRRYYFGNARKRLASSGLPKGQLAAVDVVSALFDYVVDDKRLPESAKPLLWRMQQPSLALTLLDSAYLADEPRSLRRLIENFGAIVTAFPDDMNRGSELFRRLETVVRAVEIVASSLQTRSSVLSRQVDLEFGKAANSVTQLIDRVVRERQSLEQTPDRRNRRDFGRRPTRAQEISVTEKLKNLIDERIGQHDVPQSAREFITQVWMRHLRTSVLRDGEDSQQYKVSLRVVDDLLWSLDNTKRSKTKLASKIPPLIRLLTQGMREIGAKDDEYKPFFDEIFLTHLRKMQSKSTKDAIDTLPAIGGNTAPLNPVALLTPAPLSPEAPLSPIAAAVQASSVTLPPELLAQAGLKPASTLRVPRTGSLSVDPPPVPTLRETILVPNAVVPPAAPLPPVAPTQQTIQPVSQSIDVPTLGAISEIASVPTIVPAEQGEEQLKLLDVLNQLDLNDYSESLRRLELDPARLVSALQVGDWIEMIGRDGVSSYAKVAWINHRRSVALLVRRPDRKAQSLRMTEIETRVLAKRFFKLSD